MKVSPVSSERVNYAASGAEGPKPPYSAEDLGTRKGTWSAAESSGTQAQRVNVSCFHNV